MLKIGSHVSFSGKGLLNAAEEAVSYGSSTFMIYTGAPQNTRRKAIEKQFVSEGKEIMKANNIDEIVVHAPYIVNLATYKESNFEFAVRFLQEEIQRTDYIGVKNIVLHPGSFTDKDVDYGIDRIAEGLTLVLEGTKDTDVNIALETMAGKGSEVGRNFEELARIIDKVAHNQRLTICMDTCHLHEAGYDIIDNFDGVLEQFDQTIGLDRLAVVHLNDSKNFKGAAKDRHAPVGAGVIGFAAINNIVHHERIRHLPLVLETPWIGKDKATQRPMYEAEIALLQGKAEERFGADYMDHIERLAFYFRKKEIDPREFSLKVWKLLRTDAKARKEDGREPLERLYDLAKEDRVLPELSEEQLNQRLIGLLAGVVD